jgi:hypothetical protein
VNPNLRVVFALLLSVGCGDGAAAGASQTGGSAGAAQPGGGAGGNANAGGKANTGGNANTGGASGSANAGGAGGSASVSASGSAGVAGAGGAGGAGGAAAGAGGGGGATGADCVSSPAGCGSVLYVAGESPMVGVDLQLHQVLKSLQLQVEDVRETATPAQATGKRAVVFSYSMASTELKAEDWASLPVPIIVLEHYLLPRLGMTTEANHGFHEPVTQLALVSDDPLMAAGFPKGNVTVYSKTGEFFWGIPTAQAVTIATVVGTPARAVTFGYPAGSMMAGRVAPARRVQAFVAVHAPPPNPTEMLTADGLKLFGGCVSWAIQ